jgi:hypothetical protein
LDSGSVPWQRQRERVAGTWRGRNSSVDWWLAVAAESKYIEVKIASSSAEQIRMKKDSLSISALPSGDVRVSHVVRSTKRMLQRWQMCGAFLA